MRKSLLGIFILLQIAFAGDRLTTGFEFLRTDFNPRTAAMAGSYLTMTGDVNGMFSNPAGMADIRQQNYSFNYTNYLLDISGGTAAYSRVIPKIGVLTVGVVYMDFGEFDETDDDAVSTGSMYSANSFAFVTGLSANLDEHFSYGINAKYIFSKIERYSASALALDFGLLYKAPFEKDLTFAITLTNVGTNITYFKNEKEPLPQNLRIGVSKKLAHLPLEIALSLHDLNRSGDSFSDYFKRFSAGGEFRVSETLRLRAGYDYNLYDGLNSTENDKFGGISAGLGILWKSFRIDYSYSNLSILGNVHRFGFSGIIP